MEKTLKEMLAELEKAYAGIAEVEAKESELTETQLENARYFYDQWINDLLVDLLDTGRVAIISNGWSDEFIGGYEATYKGKNERVDIDSYSGKGIRATLNYRRPNEVSVIAETEDEAIKKLLDVDELIHF